MKELPFILIMVFSVFVIWDQAVSYNDKSVEDLPVYDAGSTLNEEKSQRPYVAVYGRNSCGYTMRTIAELENAGIKYTYYKIDERTVADSIHKKMTDYGLSTRRYLLPVVDVNGEITIRPELSEILKGYQEGR
ncbi:glutaredoxin family protein [Microbulbifer epialgicus]|uniref:Glutaredoxin family protein n=1 Tax=Microbulbifer epialgicus TaxID=393907 RepID=A0ABV4P3M0_9GAMM